MEASSETAEPHKPQDEADITRDVFSPCWMLNKVYQGPGSAYEAAQAFFDRLPIKALCRRLMSASSRSAAA